MAVVKRTDLATVLIAIATRLVDKAVRGSDEVFLAMRMNVPLHEEAEQYITILPLIHTFTQDTVEGHGRWHTRMRGRVNTYLRSQCALDQSYRDTEWLTNTPLGILRTYHKMIDALHLHTLVDGDGNHLLTEPMRGVFSNEPRKERESPDWGELHLEWEVVYDLDLDVSTEV